MKKRQLTKQESENIFGWMMSGELIVYSYTLDQFMLWEDLPIGKSYKLLDSVTGDLRDEHRIKAHKHDKPRL
jgi:hypothetical protein